ncbi:unnamed protein product [Meloidogyne enterolobii]|uniref:Uncharacterized protein n=1 Tax=Meloidogyne enterolobii TaxID=390850 RepID=A0ACB1ALJ7_MELEN
MSSTLLKVAIIGEGVIGVSTALAIRQALPKAVEKAFGSIVYNFRWLTQRELSLICAKPAKFGIHYTAYAAEGRRFVSYLKNQLGNTVEYKTQKIESIKELANQDFSLIVNCAGLGGGKLAGDDENVFPNRGVGIVVKAPGQSHFCYEDADTFCIPVVGDDRVLLGTLRQDNRWDREISREDINDIWTRVTELKPSLKHSEVVSEWCGLRPDRKGGVRLEHKLLEDDKTNKQIHVIHNYGHGAKGFLLSWGCAREVLELIKNNGICE